MCVGNHSRKPSLELLWVGVRCVRQATGSCSCRLGGTPDSLPCAGGQSPLSKGNTCHKMSTGAGESKGEGLWAVPAPVSTVIPGQSAPVGSPCREGNRESRNCEHGPPEIMSLEIVLRPEAEGQGQRRQSESGTGAIEGAGHSGLEPCLIPDMGPEDLHVCMVGVGGGTRRGSIGKGTEKRRFES